jgi:hypothetical protein
MWVWVAGRVIWSSRRQAAGGQALPPAVALQVPVTAAPTGSVMTAFGHRVPPEPAVGEIGLVLWVLSLALPG